MKLWVGLAVVISILVGLFVYAILPEPSTQPTPAITYLVEKCIGTHSSGESCTKTCECAAPLNCLKGRCTRTQKSDGELCAEHAECASGYCDETDHCGIPDDPTLSTTCKLVCRRISEDYNEDCKTICVS